MFNIKLFNSCIWQAWLRFSNHINVKGLPFPMVRDPKTGKGSITATLVIASSGACLLSILLMLGVFIARINSWFVLNEDTLESLKAAFNSSFEMFLASLAAYLGRKWQGDYSSKIRVLEGAQEIEKQEDVSNKSIDKA